MTTANVARFEVSKTVGAGARMVRMSGVIDESFQGAALNTELCGSSEPIVFDLDGVRRITSFGVREWINALKALPTSTFFFVRCRPAIVSQFNMVANFGWTGTVVTFYCPYVCTQCENDVEILLDLRRQRELVVNAQPPTVECPKCKAIAEFDDIADAYFAFAAAAPPPVIPPPVEALIDGGSAAHRLPMRVEKEIEDTVTAIWLSGVLDKNARFKRLVDGLEGQVVILLQGLLGITADRMTRMSELLVAPDIDLFLARVPIDFVTWLAETQHPARRAKVLSARLPFLCGSCGLNRDVDVDNIVHASLKKNPQQKLDCQRCRLPELQLSCDDEELAAMRALAIEAPPPLVRRYLETHPNPPVRSGVGLAGSDRSLAGLQATPAFGTPSLPSPPGSLGKYELIRPIGVGGMAEVFLGRQSGPEGFAKQVVIKRILPQLANDRAFVAMFLAEARVSAGISHSNVVQIFDLGKSGNDYYIVMEYVRGSNLNDVLQLAQSVGLHMPIELCCRVVSDMCAGLFAAHTAVDENGTPRAIVHRDVSPHNVLVSNDGQVKITDFGIAKAADSANMTKTGSLKGKVAYMAPEAIVDKAIDPRCDVYATGLVLYVCLTLQQPFVRQNEFQSLYAVLNSPVDPVSKTRPETPKALDDIVAKAIARDRNQRYATAQELQLALEAFITDSRKPATSAHLGAWLSQLHAKAAQAGVLSSVGMRSADGRDLTLTDSLVTADTLAGRTPPSK